MDEERDRPLVITDLEYIEQWKKQQKKAAEANKRAMAAAGGLAASYRYNKKTGKWVYTPNRRWRTVKKQPKSLEGQTEIQ